MPVKINDMEFYTLDESLDLGIGKKDTATRKEFDKDIAKEKELLSKQYQCPGDYIKRELKQRGITQKDFALLMKMSQSNLTELLHGKRRITPLVAQRLETTLDIPKDVWLKLQSDYDERQKEKQDLSAVQISSIDDLTKAVNRLSEQISVLIALQNNNTPTVRNSN